MGVMIGGTNFVRQMRGVDLAPRSDRQEPVSALSPQQARLLELIWAVQRDTGARKIVIARDGLVRLPDNPDRTFGNLAGRFFDTEKPDPAQLGEFVRLVEEFPALYLRRYPDLYFDNPFLVQVTDEGSRYPQSRERGAG